MNKKFIAAYSTCRSLGLGHPSAAYRAARFSITGKTGRYRINLFREPMSADKKFILLLVGWFFAFVFTIAAFATL